MQFNQEKNDPFMINLKDRLEKQVKTVSGENKGEWGADA